MSSRRGAFSVLLVFAACDGTPHPATTPNRAPVRRAVGTTNSESAVWKKVTPTSAALPTARWHQAMAYNPSTRKTYVFGGMSSVDYNTPEDKCFADLWAWDGKSWTAVMGAVSPPGRAKGAMAYDPTRKSLVLYGGLDVYDNFRMLTDTWEWSEGKGWVQLQPATNPGGVLGHGMVTDTTRGKLLLFGGTFYDTVYGPNSASMAPRSDVWEWDGAATTWTRRTPAASANPPLVDPTPFAPVQVTYDEVRQKLFFYPYQVPAWTPSPPPVSQPYFWEWDPLSAGWTYRNSEDNLLGSANPGAIAFDPLRRRVVFYFPGASDDTDTAIFWEVDTKVPTWFMRDMKTWPDLGAGATMVFDGGRNCMVLWGGGSNMVWEFRVSSLENGDGCTAATAASCASGHCVDGVCCEVSACTLRCDACNVPGAEGICSSVYAGTRVPSTCGDGLACDSYQKCKTMNGLACTSDSTCASGYCADGVCCDSACTGACVSCNLTGQVGTCSSYPAGTDPESNCGAGTGPCRSTCDGAGSCANPKGGLSCGPCLTCDGVGTCTAYDRLCTTSSGLTPDVTCFVDSVNGDDGKSGLSEAEAVKSQGRIGSTCNIVRFKRGSLFSEKLRIVDNVITYGNYGDAQAPLPKFVVPRTQSSGPVIQALGKKGVTFDGLYLSGATGDGTEAGLIAGACVVFGYQNWLTNSELADCDTGVIVYDQGNFVQGNYLHDMAMGVEALAGVDPSLLGGAVGVLVRANRNQVDHNIFVNCRGMLKSTGGVGDCYGAATFISVPAGAAIDEGVSIGHNYAHNNCGFTRIGVNAGGAYSKARYGYNISVDSGWLAQLEEANADRGRDVSFSNNTVVQHRGSVNSGALIVSHTSPSTGSPGAGAQTDVVSLACNLFLVEGVTSVDNLLDNRFTLKTNLVYDLSSQDPGVVNAKGTTAADFDLRAGSPAVDGCGTLMTSPGFLWADFFGRQAPGGMRLDVGASEYGTPQAAPPPFFPGAAGWLGTLGGSGGGGGTGGSLSVVAATGGAGGSSATATVGMDAGAGGATTIASGGAGGRTLPGTGGAIDAGSTVVSPAGTGGVSGTGGSKGDASPSLDGGGSSPTSTGGVSGGTGGGTGTKPPVIGGKKGCACRLGRAQADVGLWPVLFGLALLVQRWRRGGRP